MSRTGNRGRIMLFGAVALAMVVPILSVWPAHPDVREATLLIATVVPRTRPVLTGAAIDQPLFSPTRSPTPPEAGDASTAETVALPAPIPPKLVGLVSGGRGGVALVRSQTGETVNVAVGEDVDGWRLVGIGRSAATFSNPSGRVSVALDFANKPGSGATDLPIPAPPPAGSPLTPPPPPR